MTVLEMNKNQCHVSNAGLRYSSSSNLDKCSEETVRVRKFSEVSGYNKRLLSQIDKERKDFNLKLGKYQMLLEKEHDLRMKLTNETGEGNKEKIGRRSTASSVYDMFDRSYTRCVCGRKMFSLVKSNQNGSTEEDKSLKVRTGNPRRCHHMSLNDDCACRETDSINNKKREPSIRKERPASMCEIEGSVRILEAKEKAENRKQKLHLLEQDCIKASKLISKSNSNLNQIANLQSNVTVI